MRLHEHASVLLVGLAHLFARGNGLFDLRLQVRSLGDTRAVAADAAEGRKLAPIDQLTRLLLTLECHGEHQRKRKLARAARPEQDERMRKPARCNRRAQAVHYVFVACEFVEGLW
jgi:hypothetical protein